MKKILFAALLIMGVFLSIYFYHNPDRLAETQPAPAALPPPTATLPNPLVSSTGDNAPTSADADYQAFLANKPLYLQNTDIPAEFSVDPQGNLLLNSDIRDIFDYFLLMQGDIDATRLQAIITGYIHTSLQEPARSQAQALLTRYLAYLQRYMEWQADNQASASYQQTPESMREVLTQLHDMRLEILGDAAETAFFALDEQTSQAYLEAQIAMKNAGNDPQARAEIQAELKAALPEEVRAAQEAAMTQVTLSDKLASLKAAGATQTQMEQARIAMVGTAANDRLAALDAERLQWQQKRQGYQELRQKHPGMDDMTMETMASLGEIQSLGLTTGDLLRMQALDRIDAQKH